MTQAEHNPAGLTTPPAAYCPATQATHGVSSSQSSSCVPAPHICSQISVSVQGVDGSLSLSNWPRLAQGVQAVAATAAYLPTAHSTQPVVLRESSSARPARHWIQLLIVKPSPGCQYCPARHSVHGVAELSSLSTWPAAQTLHSTSPHPAYVPDAHSVHSVDGSSSSSARPEEQKSQLAEPASLYCPAWQSSHADKSAPRDAAANRPDGQL